jgi:DNA-binding transcriptional ArsR family regulator
MSRWLLLPADIVLSAAANEKMPGNASTMSLPHPTVEQIALPAVLAVLGDPTRLAIVRHLSERANLPANCSQFLAFGSKTNLSYHLSKLREAGVTRTEIAGTSRLITLRRADLDQRFPGLLDSVLAAAAHAPQGAAVRD